MAKAAEDAKKAVPITIKKAAQTTKKNVETERNKAAGSDGKLSNVGKSGGRISARYEIDGDDRAMIRAVGPWQIIEGPTRAHPIGQGRRRKARAVKGAPLRFVDDATKRTKGSGKALKLPNGQFRRSVMHPGTKGKRPFKKGIDRTVKDSAPKLLGDARDLIGKAFG